MEQRSPMMQARNRPLRSFFLVISLVVTAFIASCATNNVASVTNSGSQTVTNAAGRQDVVTESDEPESRKRARVRLELALGYFEQGKTSIALDEIKQALTGDPTFGDAFTLRGLVYMRLADNRLAEDSFRRALALNLRDGNAAHNLGWLMCQERRFGEAQNAFTQALGNPLYNDQARTYLARGICYSRAGELENAERSLSRAFEIDAGNPVAGYNLATLLFRRQDYARAQFYLKRLNASEAANEETLWLGMKTERNLNNTEAMQDLGRKLLSKFPKSKQALSYEKRAFNE